MTNDEPAIAQALAERRHLMSLAFRMLGTIAEAEDAVQETYVRWWRMGREERAAVQAPHFWLQRVTSRICLDMLGSARARREEYVGPWLPEPLPSQVFARPAPDPADQVSLDDSVSSALLVVLETMTPAERVAFVLHDVFAVPFEGSAVHDGGHSGQLLSRMVRTKSCRRKAGSKWASTSSFMVPDVVCGRSASAVCPCTAPRHDHGSTR